jgi:spoIIIJ-associated protein
MLDESREGASEDERDEVPPADPSEVERLTERILGGLGLDIKARADRTEASILVDLSGDDREFLLSRKGEGLSALQYLLNRIIYRGRKGKKIQVDCGGFRKAREDEIIEIARHSAAKAKASGEECVLSPLNPYERRLVHMALAEIGGVATHSVGDGFLKKITIVPVPAADRDEPEDERS